MKICNLQL